MAKLRKDLKRAKALLKDAHSVAENTQTEGTSNIIMRQLKQQVSTRVNIGSIGRLRAKNSCSML